MKKEIVTAKGIGGTYSNTTAHGTKAGGFIFVTGQIANPPGTEPTKRPAEIGELGTVEQQTVRVIENIQAILAAAGSSLDHVVKRNVYITHLADFDPVYKVMERYFRSPVASTGIVAGLVPFSARVEVDVIAVVPD